MNNDDWTKESDLILLELNGGSIPDVESTLNSVVGTGRWKFIGSPRVYTNPPIAVKANERKKIVRILKLNNLLQLPRGF